MNITQSVHIFQNIDQESFEKLVEEHLSNTQCKGNDTGIECRYFSFLQQNDFTTYPDRMQNLFDLN